MMVELTSKQIKQMNQNITRSKRENSSLENPELLQQILDEAYDRNRKDLYTCQDTYGVYAKILELFEENKPFTKFNIETAVYSVLASLILNKKEMVYADRSVRELIEKMKERELSYEELLDWLLEHSKGVQKMYTNTKKLY